MKAAILETVQKKQLILFLSYFSRLLKRKARQFRFFYWPFNFCPHSLHYVSRWENHLGHSCSLLRVRGGGGGLPEHFRMEYTMVLPTSSFITIFLVSPFGRGFCFNFLDPGIQPRSRKKNHILVFATPLTFTALFSGCHRLIHSTKKSFLETRFL